MRNVYYIFPYLIDVLPPLVVISANDVSANVSWSQPEGSELVDDYAVMLTRITDETQILCKEIEDNRPIQNVTNSSMITLNDLHEFSVYKIIVTVIEYRINSTEIFITSSNR